MSKKTKLAGVIAGAALAIGGLASQVFATALCGDINNSGANKRRWPASRRPTRATRPTRSVSRRSCWPVRAPASGASRRSAANERLTPVRRPRRRQRHQQSGPGRVAADRGRRTAAAPAVHELRPDHRLQHDGERHHHHATRSGRGPGASPRSTARRSSPAGTSSRSKVARSSRAGRRRPTRLRRRSSSCAETISTRVPPGSTVRRRSTPWRTRYRPHRHDERSDLTRQAARRLGWSVAQRRRAGQLRGWRG